MKRTTNGRGIWRLVPVGGEAGVKAGTLKATRQGLDDFFKRRGMVVGSKKRTKAEIEKIRKGDRSAI